MIENHIKEKRDEIIWSLSLQNYTFAQIARMFNLDRSTVMRIIEKKPVNWNNKWKKVI
jgi:DNA invertase Pin-like site-specific DNA recombinase